MIDTVLPRLDLFETPLRVMGSMTGSEFGHSIMNMPSGRARELAIYQQLCLGNIPDFLRRGLPVSVTGGGHCATFWTMPDYLAIGTDANFLRMPMRPTTAQKAADLFGAVLPTRKMMREIWKAMPLHLTPKTMDWKGPMSSVAYFGEHNSHIQAQLAGRPPELGVAGHKKDVLVCNGRPRGNVAIGGWQYLDGREIQGLNARDHDIPYLDYSHGIRWCFEQMLVDGDLKYVIEVLQDPELFHLISDDGVYGFDDVRYPTEL